MCFLFTQDLIINIAIDVIHFRGVEYISEDISFVALYLPSGVFHRTVCFKQQRETLLIKTIMLISCDKT